MGKLEDILAHMIGIPAGIGIALLLNAAIGLFVLGVTDLVGSIQLTFKNVLNFSIGLTLLNAVIAAAKKVFEDE